MSYHRTGLGSFDKEQLSSLAVSPEELAKLDPDTRAELLMRHHEIKAQKRSTFWSAVESIAVGALPMMAFLGITSLWGKKTR
jgi:hypothetical protein